jgi:hypothetical protein
VQAQQLIDCATEVARGKPDDHRQQRRQHPCCEADEQGSPRPQHNLGEDILPGLCSAQQVCQRRRLQLIGAKRKGVAMYHQRADECDEEKEAHDAQAETHLRWPQRRLGG